MRIATAAIQNFGFLLNRIYLIFSLNRFTQLEKLYLAAYFLYKRNLEKSNLVALNCILRDDAIVIDCGAGLGFYTRFFANFCRMGQVFAFEPETLNHKRCNLALGCELKKVVTVENLALSDSEREIKLFVDRFNPANHSISDSSESDVRQLSVKATTLDKYLSERGIAPSFIKMDLQGHEYEALVGVKTVLQRAKNLTLMIELDLQNNREKCLKVMDLLRDLDYEPKLPNRRGQLEPLSISRLNKCRYIDVFFVQKV